MRTFSAGFASPPYNIYYETIRPSSPTSHPPILMIHGGGQSGACYRATPDGRPGWANRFVELGFPCIIADWPGVGRSGHVRLETIDYAFAAEAFGALVRELGGRTVVMTHSMSGPIGWKLLETATDQVELVVGIAPGPPGNIQPILAPVTDDRPDHGIVEETDNFVHIRVRGADLRIELHQPFTDSADYLAKGAVGNSTRFPKESDMRSSAMSYPPRMLLERVNWRGSALRLGPDVDLSGCKALVVTGTADTNHRREDDKAIVEFLSERGARSEFLYLGDVGIEGNGHMLMGENNSDEIAELIATRILYMTGRADQRPPHAQSGQGVFVP